MERCDRGLGLHQGPSLLFCTCTEVGSRCDERRQWCLASVQSVSRRSRVKLLANSAGETSLIRVLLTPLGYVTSAVASLWLQSRDKELYLKRKRVPEIDQVRLPTLMTAAYRHETERVAYDELLRHQVRLLPLYPIDLDSLDSITHLIMAAEYVAWLEQAVETKFAAALRWIGLLSSTSLYAEAPDAWLDESAPLDLSKERTAGLWRAEVRTAALARALGIPLAVFRLGAVYGPIPAHMRGRRGWTRRSVLDTLTDGRKHGEESAASSRPLNKLVNRIHVGDAAHLLLAGLGRSIQGVYNLVDDEPATRSQVEAYAKQCRANERSTRAYADSDAARLTQVSSTSELIRGGKRIRNNRAKIELLGGCSTLWFPSYRDGVRAIAAGDSFPFLPKQILQDG